MMPQLVAQPLHRRAGDEDRCPRARTSTWPPMPPGDRREQAVRATRTGSSPGVHQHEAAGAVGVLRAARLEAGLTEERRLLVARDAGDRDARRRSSPASVSPYDARSWDAPRAACCARDAEARQELLVPAQPSRCRTAACATRWSTSVTCTAPPVRFQTSQRVDRAERELAAFGACRARRATLSRIQRDLGRRRSRRRARARCARGPSARGPARLSSSQMPAVRRHCHTIALDRPARRSARSQTMVVSRWLVMPMAAMSCGRHRARLAARRATARSCDCQISTGSCSTQPGFG